MNRKISLPVELTLVTDDEKILAETVYARKFSLQALEKDCDNKRISIKTISGKCDKPREGDKYNEKEKDLHGPEDKYNLVLIMTFILGLIHTLPGSFFSTANEYWMYKFRDPSSNSTDANDRTYLQANFSSLNHLITMGPSTVASFLITFYAHKVRAKSRVLFTLTTHSLIFVLQTAFVGINTDTWQMTFFCITMIIMTVLSCTGSFASTGNMVIVSQFPERYMKCYLIGEGVASLVNAIMRLISIICAPSTIGAALIYFVTGSILISLSSILFYLTTKVNYFRYHTHHMKKFTRKRIPKYKEFKNVLKYLRPFLILHTVSLIFPHSSITSLVVSEYYGTDSVWGNKYFVTCITYLLNSVCGIVGRILFYKYEIDPPMYAIFIISIAREIIFSPLMYFVNAKPRSHLPVFFPHDWQYALILGTQSLSGGYFSNILTLKQMRIVPADKLELSWMVTFLVMKILSVINSPLGVLAVDLL